MANLLVLTFGFYWVHFVPMRYGKIFCDGFWIIDRVAVFCGLDWPSVQHLLNILYSH